jgi:hypothetical protein
VAILAAVSAAAGGVAFAAGAATKTYIGNTGLWSSAGGWNPAGVPVSGDTVILQPGFAPGVTVTYDGTVLAPNTTIASLTINSTSASTISLTQSTNMLLVSGGETVGDTGIGSFVLNGGTHAVGGLVTIGNAAAASGTLTLIGGVLSANDVLAGGGGSGLFQQTGGVVNTNFIEVGRNAGSTGIYTLTGGTVSVNSTLFVGLVGAGTLNQSSATANVAVMNIGSAVGGSGGVGTYNLSNGASLTVLSTSSIGTIGQGSFNQAGGQSQFNDTITIGGGTVGVGGNFTLTGGTMTATTITLTNNGHFNLGANAAGALTYTSFNQFGGTFTASGGEFVGGTNNGSGGGSASYAQSGGTHTVVFSIAIASADGASGTYTLGGGLLSAGEIDAGFRGTGTLSQSGGLLSTSFLTVGRVSTGHGLYTLSGGTAAISLTFQVDDFGNGIVNQSGGTASAAGFRLGDQGGVGTYNLSNGASLTVTNQATIGGSGQGIFTQTGGQATFNGGMVLGRVAGGSGTVSLLGGTMSSGTNAIVLNAGSRFNLGPVALGSLAFNTINQTGGLFVASGDEAIGFTNAATYTQSGGTHTAATNLLLAATPGSSGTYTLSNGGLLLARDIFIGGNSSASGGAARLIASAGATVTVTNNVKVWNAASALVISGGTVNLSNLDLGGVPSRLQFTAGTLHITGVAFDIDAASVFGPALTLGANQALNVDPNEFIGFTSGSGTFNQTGGSHSANALLLGVLPGVSGSYSMSNGAVLTITHSEQIGSQGIGTFNQTGGSHTVGGPVNLGASTGGSGTFNLSGGSFIMPAGTLYAGPNGNGALTISGGSAVVGGLEVGGIAGTASLLGGTLIASGISVYPGGSFNIVVNSASALSYTNFAQLGGTVAASVNEFIGAANAATYTQSGGTHTVGATLLLGDPSGTSGGSTYTLRSGLLSASTIQVNPASTFNLQGGSILADTIQTATNATFRGQGVLSPIAPLNNAGTLMASSGDLTVVAPSLVNTGTLANAGLARLFVVGTNVTHTGSIVANSLGGVSFEVPITNVAGQSITLAGGGVIAPLVTNAPGGTVSGFGQIGGHFVNNGTAVTFSGPTQIVGSVTNAATALVTVRNSQLLITGPTINNGTIRAITGGSIASDGGLTGNAVVGAGATPAAVSYSGATGLDPGSTLTTPYVQQDSLTLRGNAGVPSSYSLASIRLRRDGGSDSTLRLLSIQMSGGNALGSLDLADTRLTVDATATPPGTVKTFIASAYTSNQDWSGAGLTSSLARGNPVKYSLAYASGSDQSAQDAGVPVDPGKVLSRVVLTGDANLDGGVDFFDIAQVLGYRYNAGGNDAAYTDGDLDYSGAVDFFDIVTLLSANYNSGEVLASAAPAMASAAVPAQLPEPAGLGALALAAARLLLPGRGRRRRQAPAAAG